MKGLKHRKVSGLMRKVFPSPTPEKDPLGLTGRGRDGSGVGGRMVMCWKSGEGES